MTKHDSQSHGGIFVFSPDVAVYSAKTVFCRDTRAYTIVMLLYIVSLLSRKATWVDILFAAAAAARPVAFWNLLSMNDLGVLDDIFYRHFGSFLLTPIMDDGTQMHHIYVVDEIIHFLSTTLIQHFQEHE